MTPATTEGERVRFHTLNRKTGDRIFTRYVDAASGKTVEDDNLAKGYEKADGDYVILEDEELEAVQLESARTIDIDTFVPAESIEWVYYDTPYFVTPNDEVGEEAFSVIRQAMASKRVVGISRLVLWGRERAVMLEPRDTGIVLWTLRYGDEVRDEGEYFKGLDDKPDARMLHMIATVIDERTKPWAASMMNDPVQERLLDIIKAKQKHGSRKQTKPPAQEAPEPASNVIDIMAALKRSLEGRPAGSKRKSR
jgi:DNA end-binding protein Ku